MSYTRGCPDFLVDIISPTVVEWDVGDMHKRSCQLAWMFFGMDGGKSLKSVLAPSGEPTLPNVDTGNDETLAQLPQVLGGHWQGFGLRIEREFVHFRADFVYIRRETHRTTLNRPQEMERVESRRCHRSRRKSRRLGAQQIQVRLTASN